MTKKILMLGLLATFAVACSSRKPEAGQKQSGFISYSSNKDDYPTFESHRLPSSEEGAKKFHCQEAYETKFMSYSGSKDFFPHPEHEGQYLHCK